MVSKSFRRMGTKDFQKFVIFMLYRNRIPTSLTPNLSLLIITKEFKDKNLLQLTPHKELQENRSLKKKWKELDQKVLNRVGSYMKLDKNKRWLDKQKMKRWL